MSWATNDKENICFYLGMKHTQETYDLIQSRMDRITGLSTYAVDQLQLFLSEVQQLETEIEAVRDNNPPDSFAVLFTPLKAEARRWVKRVAIALDLDIQEEVF